MLLAIESHVTGFSQSNDATSMWLN